MTEMGRQLLVVCLRSCWLMQMVWSIQAAARAAFSILRMRFDRRGGTGLQETSIHHPSTICQPTAGTVATPAHPWEAQCPSIGADAANLQVSGVGDRMVDPAPSSGARLQVVRPVQRIIQYA